MNAYLDIVNKHQDLYESDILVSIEYHHKLIGELQAHSRKLTQRLSKKSKRVFFRNTNTKKDQDALTENENTILLLEMLSKVFYLKSELLDHCDIVYKCDGYLPGGYIIVQQDVTKLTTDIRCSLISAIYNRGEYWKAEETTKLLKEAETMYRKVSNLVNDLISDFKPQNYALPTYPHTYRDRYVFFDVEQYQSYIERVNEK